MEKGSGRVRQFLKASGASLLTCQDEGVEKASRQAMASLMLPLSARNALCKASSLLLGRLIVAIDYDVRDHGQLAGLNLEIANREAVFGVTLEERIPIYVEKLVRGNGTFQFRRGQVPSHLDDGDASDASWDFADRLSPRHEEGQLDLVFRM